MYKGKTIFVCILTVIILALASLAIFFGIEKIDKNIFASLFSNSSETTKNPESNSTSPSAEQQGKDSSARLKEIDAILSDPYMVLVNPNNALTAEDVLENPAELDTKFGSNGEVAFKMEQQAAAQLEKMLTDAKANGHTIYIFSSYRTYYRQESNYNNKVNQYLAQGYSTEKAKELAANIVNPPGKSEHQTGLAADICAPELVYKYNSLPQEFEDTEAYKWLYENCAKYGFILRYPKDKEDQTGITFEPWHYRYVGIEQAKEIMSRKISLEEYIEQLKNEKLSLQK